MQKNYEAFDQAGVVIMPVTLFEYQDMLVYFLFSSSILLLYSQSIPEEVQIRSRSIGIYPGKYKNIDVYATGGVVIFMAQKHIDEHS